MSNSKWVKLIAALVANWSEVKQCLVEPIWDDSEVSRQLLIEEHTYYDFDYYATAMESMISGNPRGWYVYREIEWLEFPRTMVTESGVCATQNLALIQDIINKVGQCTVEVSEENLKLYAYFR